LKFKAIVRCAQDDSSNDPANASKGSHQPRGRLRSRLRGYKGPDRDEIEEGDHLLLRFELFRLVGDHERMNEAYVAMYEDLVRQEEECVV
jgi:hypothetical protein